VDDTSVWWLSAPWTGTWAGLDPVLDDLLADDCGWCGGWRGPLEVVSWSDDSRAVLGDVLGYCRACAVQLTADGAWGPQEMLARLGVRPRSIGGWRDAVRAAHARRVPASRVGVDQVATGAWPEGGDAVAAAYRAGEPGGWQAAAVQGVVDVLDGCGLTVDATVWAVDASDADGDDLPPGEVFLTAGDGRQVTVLVSVVLVEGALS